MPQWIKLPIGNALTAIPQAQRQQAPSFDIAIDLILRFACQSGENQQWQVIRSLKRGQHFGAFTLDFRHMRVVKFFSSYWRGHDRRLVGPNGVFLATALHRR